MTSFFFVLARRITVFFPKQRDQRIVETALDVLCDRLKRGHTCVFGRLFRLEEDPQVL